MHKPRLIGYVAIDPSETFTSEHLQKLEELESKRQNGLLSDPTETAQWQKLYVMYQSHQHTQNVLSNSGSLPPLNLPSIQEFAEKKTSEKSEDTDFSIYVNDVKYTPDITDTSISLLKFIRTQIPGKTGTKQGCNEGGCGACTVMLTETDGTVRSVNSCLRPLVACNGMHVTTVEGIGSEATGFHEIQQRLADYDGTQCGFCSPGFVMNLYSYLTANPNATPQDIEKRFDGNICRCTGYRPILAAFKSLSKSTTEAPSSGCAGLCAKKGKCSKDEANACNDHTNDRRGCKNSCKLSDMYSDIEELPLPKVADYNHVAPHRKTEVPTTTKLADKNTQWFFPSSLAALLQLMNTYSPSDYSLVFGHTSAGIYKDWSPKIFLSLANVPELRGFSSNPTQNTLSFGSCTPIADFLAQLIQCNASNDFTPDQKLVFPELIYLVGRVANVHIRNAGSIGGNLMLANKHQFQSDLCIALMGIGASLLIVSASSNNATSVVPIDQFVNMNMDGSVVRSIIVPLGKPGLVTRNFKIAHRNVFAKSVVNAGFSVVVNNGIIENPILAYGNIRYKQARMTNTEQFLNGKNILDGTLFTKGAQILLQELAPDSRIPDDVEYRKAVSVALFYKFYLAMIPGLPSNLQSAVQRFERPLSSGEQSYQSDQSEFPVSSPIHKIKGVLQCSGEAKYTNDIPKPGNTLHAAFVLTPIANADIVGVDTSAALAVDGVVGWVSAKDIPGYNTAYQLPLFATDKCLYAGQAVGLIVAKTQEIADRASKLVVVQCANAQKPILTIDEAVAANSFYDTPLKPVQQGDVASGFKESDYVIKGTVKNGGQYHYHIETQSCLVLPGEDNEIQIYAATQLTSYVVQIVSAVLGIPRSKVGCTVRRCGGGYGGKLANSLVTSGAASVAAKKFGVPISIVMDIETNMRMLGLRPEVQTDYTVGVMKDGTLKAIQMNTIFNTGCGFNDTIFAATAFLLSCYGPYNTPNFYCDTKLAKTHTAAATSVRGPGWTPGTFHIEHIIEHVANYLNLPPADLKRKNFFTKGATTPDGTKLVYWNLDTIFDQLRSVSDFDKRLQEVNDYNSKNQWTKKGLAFVPLRWAAGWTGARLPCNITILGDGTVIASHGGVEIGQGIDTKVAQTIAYKLGIPIASINILNHSAQLTPEASPTGGSITSELACASAIDACDQLLARLAPIRQQLGNPAWDKLIGAAYQQGLNLQTIGLFVPPPPPNAPDSMYQSYSAVVQEVLVDILTGEHQMLRADILFDCGISLNPAIDIGQVEGAYVMGVGLFTTEEISYDPTTGALKNFNTWTYKPPSYADIPVDLRVGLLKNSPNPVGVLSSKVVGEPPLALACASVLAVQQAVAAAKKAAGQDVSNFGLNAPVLPENVFLNSGIFKV